MRIRGFAAGEKKAKALSGMTMYDLIKMRAFLGGDCQMIDLVYVFTFM